MRTAQDPTCLPTRMFDALWHVGTFDPADKKAFSYEGRGLSVSEHPEDWTTIARLGGYPTWTLTRTNNTFLDYHALTADQRDTITTWGLDHGYVTTTTAYEVSWFDDEADDTLTMLCASQADAAAEAEGRDTGDGSPSVPVAVSHLAATVSFPDPTVSAGDLDVHAILTTAWVSTTQPDLDGVWWEDTHDVAALSCPRGVIDPARLTAWTVTRDV